MVLAYESAAKSQNFLAEPAAVAAAMMDDLRAGLTTGGSLASIGGTKGDKPDLQTPYRGSRELGTRGVERGIPRGDVWSRSSAADLRSMTHE